MDSVFPLATNTFNPFDGSLKVMLFHEKEEPASGRLKSLQCWSERGHLCHLLSGCPLLLTLSPLLLLTERTQAMYVRHSFCLIWNSTHSSHPVHSLFGPDIRTTLFSLPLKISSVSLFRFPNIICIRFPLTPFSQFYLSPSLDCNFQVGGTKRIHSL